MTTREIFISHAAADKPLADSFVVGLLESGIGLTHDQIFCTSLEGQGIPAGKDFKQYIREQLAESQVVVALITPSYYASTFCVSELGATWILSKNFIPVLVPPITFDDLRGVLLGTHCLRVDKEQDLDSIYDSLKGVAKAPTATARWNTRRANFLKELPKLLTDLKQPKNVKPEELAAAKNEASEYKNVSEQLDAEVETLKKELADVRALKDRSEVAHVRRKHSKEADQFDQVVSETKKALRGVQRGARETLYYWFRGEVFNPDRDWSEEVDAAAEHGQIINTRGENAFYPNEAKPIVKKAMQALEDLRNFVEKASPDFHEDFEAKYEDNLDPTTRDFWERFLR